jgi:colanic acid/amylovoran biosynthesis glycosyltransferase
VQVALITSMKHGLTQFIFRDVRALRGRGVDVRLFTLHSEPGLYNPLPDWPLEVASPARAAIASFRLLVTEPRAFVTLLKHALRHRAISDFLIAAQFRSSVAHADLIYAYFGDHKLFVGMYLHRMTGVPLSVTIRAYELYRNPNERLFREALGDCVAVLTITEHNKSQLVERFGVEPERIEIVRQIVDLDTHKARDVITLLIVGFFAEKKGHDVLLKAVSLLDDPRLEVWVVGDITPTVLSTDVRAVARELGIEHQVAFFGAQSGAALRALYREADIFCLPSRKDSLGDHEGFPNVIAEAMAFGKPVVATRHAGIPEAVEDRYLVDEDDAEGLAEVLRRVIESPELRHSMGSDNRARAEEMFSPENTVRLESALRNAATKDSE